MKRSYLGGFLVKFCPTKVTLVTMRFHCFCFRLPVRRTLNISSSATGRTCTDAPTSEVQPQAVHGTELLKMMQTMQHFPQVSTCAPVHLCVRLQRFSSSKVDAVRASGSKYLRQRDLPLASLLLSLLLDGIAEHLGAVHLPADRIETLKNYCSTHTPRHSHMLERCLVLQGGHEAESS